MDVVALSPEKLRVTGQVKLRCRPISLAPEAALKVAGACDGLAARFTGLSFEALTSFFAFDVIVRSRGGQLAKSFVLNLPLEGTPADRGNRLLLALLGNAHRLLRYLMLVLADTDISARAFAGEHDAADHEGPVAVYIASGTMPSQAAAPARVSGCFTEKHVLGLRGLRAL